MKTMIKLPTFSQSTLLSLVFVLILCFYSAYSSKAYSGEDNRSGKINEQTANNQRFTIDKTAITVNIAKQDLMAKLSEINYINAKFKQIVVNEDDDVLQEGYGTLAISKPNLVNWHTTEPSETLIVSDGKDLWFYDPFIDQVSLYSLSKSIANTPVLLLTSEDPALWNNFQVSQINNGNYVIHSLDVNSQVKSLELSFNNEQLSKLSILDSTGQVSHISLIDVDFITQPKASLFEFVISEGITVDDQR